MVRAPGGDGAVRVERLSQNYRNSREIAELAAHFYSGLKTGIAELPDRRGEVPVLRRVSSKAEASKYIANYYRRNPAVSIGVLVPPRDRLRKRFAEQLREELGREVVQTYEGGKGKEAARLDFDRPRVTVITYLSAKGLEFDAVFMPELQELEDMYREGAELNMVLYVMISRARDNLFLLYRGDRGQKYVERLFPVNKVEWRP